MRRRSMPPRRTTIPALRGYRVPTVNEFIEMAKAVTGLETMVYGDTSYKVTDLAAVFARSPLKMPWAGQAVVGGTVSGGRGVYWTNMPITPAQATSSPMRRVSSCSTAPAYT